MQVFVKFINHAERDKKSIEFWLTENNNKKLKNIILDGPPYANGDAHIGHALNKFIKDTIARKLNSELLPGWDFHGLPIEQACSIDKKKKQSKNEIRALCREHAKKYSKLQRQQFYDIGICLSDKQYTTDDFQYQADVTKKIYDLFEKNLLSLKTIPILWSIEEQTALSHAEVEYKNVEHESVYFGFNVVESEEKLQMLVWTTMPWTIPANEAIAFNPYIQYNVYLKEGKRFIASLSEEKAHLLGMELLETGFEKMGSLKYVNPFKKGVFSTISSENIEQNVGTSLLHCAPCHGEEDFYLCEPLKQTFISPFNLDGTSVINGISFKTLDEANKFVVAYQDAVFSQKFTHSFPHSWRSKKQLFLFPTEQVFLDISELKQLAIKRVEQIKWHPVQAKHGMLGAITSRSDSWCISRQRTWGIPIMLYKNSKNELTISQELKDKNLQRVLIEGTDFWFDEEEKRKDGLIQLQHIIDVWFESGIASNNLKVQDAILVEGVDQFRGWFQSLLMLHNEGLPARDIVVHGYTLDSKGEKMSKSLGNVLTVDEALKKAKSIDSLRYALLSCDFTKDISLNDELFAKSVKNMTKLRLTIHFLFNFLCEKEERDYGVTDGLDLFLVHKIKKTDEAIHLAFQTFKLNKIYADFIDCIIINISKAISIIKKETTESGIGVLVCALKFIVSSSQWLFPSLYCELVECGVKKKIEKLSFTSHKQSVEFGELERIILEKEKVINKALDQARKSGARDIRLQTPTFDKMLARYFEVATFDENSQHDLLFNEDNIKLYGLLPASSS